MQKLIWACLSPKNAAMATITWRPPFFLFRDSAMYWRFYRTVGRRIISAAAALWWTGPFQTIWWAKPFRYCVRIPPCRPCTYICTKKFLLERDWEEVRPTQLLCSRHLTDNLAFNSVGPNSRAWRSDWAQIAQFLWPIVRYWPGA